MTETTISDKSLIELFTESVRKYPDNIAVIDNDDMITYGGLDQMSNQMANYLKEKEIEKGDKVAILGYRDFNTIVGVLGILKLGAAYVPLDPEVPKERREFIRKNSEYKYLLDTKMKMSGQSTHASMKSRNLMKPPRIYYLYFR